MSRRSMPYHRRYHQDALQGYRKLTLEQRGAYTTILDLIYDEGGPIDNNERWLAGELNCSLRKARVLIDELISERKLYITGRGKISNHRAETELENALKISRKCAESVSKREEKKREKSEITKKIKGTAERSISDRSSIPYTSTIYNKPTLEFDVAREEEPAPDDGVDVLGFESEAMEDGTTLHRISSTQRPHPSDIAAGDRLIRALEGRGSGRASLNHLLAVRRDRGH